MRLRQPTRAGLMLLLWLVAPKAFAQELQKPELIVQTGHYGAVNSLAFTPDGRLLVSASNDSTIRFWDPARGQELRSLSGHADAVNAVALSRDGTLLASGSSDGTVMLWRVDTGELVRTLTVKAADSDSPPAVNALAFSPDGRMLASGGEDKLVRLWETATGEESGEPFGGELEVNSLAFSPDGRTLVVGSGNAAGPPVTAELSDGRLGIGAAPERGEVSVWDVATRSMLKRLGDFGGRVYSVSYSADGRFIVCAREKGYGEAGGEEVRDENGTHVWDAKSYALLASFPTSGHAALSPDGRLLAASVSRKEVFVIGDGAASTKIMVWDLTGRRLLREIKAHNDVGALAFNPRDGSLAGALNQGAPLILNNTMSGAFEESRPQLWDARTGRETVSFKKSLDAPRVSPRGRYLSLWRRGRTHYYEDDGDLNTFGNYDGAAAAWSADDAALAVQTGDGRAAVRAAVWHLPTGATTKLVDPQLPNPEAEGAPPRPRRLEFAFSPDGKYVAGRDDYGGRLSVWDARTGRAVWSLQLVEGSTQVAFGTSGLLGVCAQGRPEGKELGLYDVAAGRLVSEVPCSYSFAFSPDGALVATATGSAVAVWDARTGRRVRALMTPGEDGRLSFNVWAMAFSPDGRRLVVTTKQENHPVAYRMPKLRLPVLDLEPGQLVLPGPDGVRHEPSVRKRRAAVPFDPDESMTAAVFDVEKGDKVCRFAAGGSTVFGAGGGVVVNRDGNAIKLWSAETCGLLATVLHFDRGEGAKPARLVVTPDGLFDGDVAAFGNVFWRLSSAVGDVLPAEAFMQEFYRPGLLADIMAGERPAAPRDMLKLDRRQPQLRLAAVGVQPGTTAVGREVTVRVEVAESGASQPQGGSGAQDVRLFRNGSLVKLWRGDVLRGRGGATLETSVPVVAGENLFTAYAFNRDNVKSGDAQLVVKGARALDRKGVAYVLAVGVNAYANANFDLAYAVPDAESFAAEFKRQQARLGQYGRVEVVPLLDARATKANVLRALAGLAAKSQPEDAVVVYFAGHGKAHDGHFYLIPHDLGYAGPRERIDEAGRRTILEHSISDRELEQAFERVDAGRLLLVIDACESGQALGGERERRGPMNSKGLGQLAYEKGIYVLAAAQSYQAAKAASSLGHGYLTYALVEEGLKTAAADADQDRQVVLREWLDYAARRVPRMQEGSDEYRQLVQGGGGVQRPRVFYRREPESTPLLVARASAAADKPARRTRARR